MLLEMGRVLALQGQNEAALAWYGEAAELYRVVGDRSGEKNALDGLGEVAEI